MKKLVFVTGGARGIGKLMALRLLEDGFEVHVCSRNKQNLSDFLQDTNFYGQQRSASEVDVSERIQIQDWMLNTINRSSARPWGLVTSAGIYGPMGSFVETDIVEWETAVKVNLFGTAHSCQIFSQILLNHKTSGRIVTVSGGGAERPMINLSSYGASKAAVVRFSETLALELSPHQITVNSINPGAFATHFNDLLLSAGPEKIGETLYRRAQEIQQGRGADPEKVKGLISYLMSEKSKNVSGLLISAVWDPWAQFHNMMEDLNQSERYKLRRIQPKF